MWSKNKGNTGFVVLAEFQARKCNLMWGQQLLLHPPTHAQHTPTPFPSSLTPLSSSLSQTFLTFLEAAVPGGSPDFWAPEVAGVCFCGLAPVQLSRLAKSIKEKLGEKRRFQVCENSLKVARRRSRERQVWMCCGALGEGTEGGRQGSGRRPGRGGGASIIRIAPWLEASGGEGQGAELRAQANRLMWPQQRGLCWSHWWISRGRWEERSGTCCTGQETVEQCSGAAPERADTRRSLYK